MSIIFQNSFQSLPRFFFEEIEPTPLRDASLLHVSSLRQELGLSEVPDHEFRTWLNGESRIEGDQRIATRYAGHQFGVWAGQLGDGRAVSLGEILSPEDTGVDFGISRGIGRREVQVKGLGKTPFSRFGDGKAVLRSCIREYLCAEAMHALGIPTTRSLAILAGTGAVEREEVETEASVVRVFPSQVRFGHFEMAKHFDRKSELGALIEYTLTQIYPGHSIESMLAEVIDRTARMIALWQSVGFCHGVMNTDNMSILGLTLDYGPFGFMEDFNSQHICNLSDREGRYAYARQPHVGMENLERLLVCFTDHVPRERLIALLETFPERYREHYLFVMRQKLGLVEPRAGDAVFLQSLWSTLEQCRVDSTFFFRSLSRYESGKIDSMDSFFESYPVPREDASLVVRWLKEFDDRLKLEGSTDSARIETMLQKNPKFVLKNPVAGAVIAATGLSEGTLIGECLRVLQSPFEEHPEMEGHPHFGFWARPLPEALKNRALSCSS